MAEYLGPGHSHKRVGTNPSLTSHGTSSAFLGTWSASSCVHRKPPDHKIVREGRLVIRARNRSSLKSSSTNVFRSKHGYGYDEERSFNDHIPLTFTFAWVDFFYSGFVEAKFPFPLTRRFRSMLQNGIDLRTVDVSYVGSRSWYFLNLFGLRGMFRSGDDANGCIWYGSIEGLDRRER